MLTAFSGLFLQFSVTTGVVLIVSGIPSGFYGADGKPIQALGEIDIASLEDLAFLLVLIFDTAIAIFVFVSCWPLRIPIEKIVKIVSGDKCGRPGS